MWYLYCFKCHLSGSFPEPKKKKSDNAAVSYPLGVISVWHVLTIHVYQNTSKWTVHYQVLPVCQPFNGPPPPFMNPQS